ncbi:MAG: mechanosensitive ion channel [Ignavibacteria bacterium]|nr:mechanosensitive ion channel [Ignavibacteria bacterium]
MNYVVFLCLLLITTEARAQDASGVSDYVTLASQPADVVVDGRFVVRYYATLIGSPPSQRAEATTRRIDYALEHMSDGKIGVSKSDVGYAIMLDESPTVFVTALDKDPLSPEPIEKVVEQSRRAIESVSKEYREARSLPDIMRGIAVTIIATALLYVLLRLLLYGRRKILNVVVKYVENFIQQTKLRSLAISSRLINVILFRTISIIAITCIAIACFFYLSVVFEQFPITRSYGEHMLSIVSDSAYVVMRSVIQSVPGLLMVAIILVVAMYVNRGINAILDRIETGAVRVAVLDQDVAAPTRRIASILVWVFALALAYPFIPGSSTDAFKGVSVVVGLMLSLGAAGAVGQVASGLMIMYSRKIKVGDWVTIGEHTGKIESIGFAATRLATSFMEEILIPNGTVMTTTVVNHTRLAESGTMYSTSVTIGYDAPWRLIRKMMIAAAAKTKGISVEPAPYVTQVTLSDFFVEYRLTVNMVDPNLHREVVDELHATIQDMFNENGVQIMSPHYHIDSEKPKIIDKKMWDPPLISDQPLIGHQSHPRRLERVQRVRKDEKTEEAGNGISAPST